MRDSWSFEKELTVSLLTIIVGVMLALCATGADFTRKAMDIVASGLAPVERPAILLLNQIAGLRRWTDERRILLQQLAELREENRALRLAVGERGADALKALVRPANRYPIVYRDPRLWWESVKIGTGSERFEAGTAVLDGSDLVGVITSQDEGSAWVRLITGANFYVPVVVESTREIGVVTGDGAGGVWLRYLPSEGDYTAGMKIYTVLGSRLSAGLPVGELTGERRTIIPGLDEYKIKPGADLFRLQYLHVHDKAQTQGETPIGARGSAG